MQKEIVFIGLGRMGNAMTAHLVEEGYTVHGHDVDPEARQLASENGVTVYDSLPAAIAAMPGQKVVWLMIPAKFVDSTLVDIHSLMQPEDIIIDGGNSFYKDTLTRAAASVAKNITYIDCGTSGGVDGARKGASLMVGGPTEVVNKLEPLFTTLAAKNGFGHVGKTGAGHFVKMVHNGIEYGMMGAIAEGMSFVERQQSELDIKPLEVLKPYEHGSIISSSLMSWLAEAYNTPSYLESIAGEVPQGETEMEMEYIVAQNQSPVLEAALQQRKDTRQNPSRTGTLISAMRNTFGGHKTIKK